MSLPWHGAARLNLPQTLVTPEHESPGSIKRCYETAVTVIFKCADLTIRHNAYAYLPHQRPRAASPTRPIPRRPNDVGSGIGS